MIWIQTLGWVGSALLVWSLLQTRILRLRVWNLIGSVALIVFNVLVHVWPMVGLNVTLAAINVWYLNKLLRTRHDDGTFDVVEVSMADEFLGHLLRVHGADIAKFNPKFALDTAETHRTAYVIVSGDEAVGVVIIRPDAADASIANVDLDYVTPRFRDFTPGEFVYRRSSIFADHGFRRVVSPPGMVAPYYGRLGFRREGESFVLTIPA